MNLRKTMRPPSGCRKGDTMLLTEKDITPEWLIKALHVCGAAFSGPWLLGPRSGVDYDDHQYVSNNAGYSVCCANGPKTAEFLVLARNAWCALLAVVTQLRRTVDYLATDRDKALAEQARLAGHNQRLACDNASLRALVQECQATLAVRDARIMDLKRRVSELNRDNEYTGVMGKMLGAQEKTCGDTNTGSPIGDTQPRPHAIHHVVGLVETSATTVITTSLRLDALERTTRHAGEATKALAGVVGT